jgi:hypothetical protein
VRSRSGIVVTYITHPMNGMSFVVTSTVHEG